jgi:hypothetical protein
MGFTQRPVMVYQAPPDADRFPRGTSLVLYDPVHGRTYFAIGAALDSIALSADGKGLIVRSIFDSYVLQAADLRLLRYLRDSHAWWEGSRLGYDGWNGYLLTGGRKVPASNRQREILAPDPKGKFFLAARQISPGTMADGYLPTYQLQLWERTERSSLQFSRDLAIARYDPGSTAVPRRLAVLSKSVAVFGYPGGHVDAEDFVCVLQGSRVSAPLKDSQGRQLQFYQSPVVAADAIVGLADAVGPPYVLSTTRYLYRVTATEIALQPIAANVVFVTYHPERKAVGLGVSDPDGVSVKDDN